MHSIVENVPNLFASGAMLDNILYKFLCKFCLWFFGARAIVVFNLNLFHFCAKIIHEKL